MSKKAWRVDVTWRDSTLNSDGWLDIADHLKGRWGDLIHSVGFVLCDNKKGLTLASSVHGKRAAGVVNIPRGMIVKRRRMR
jgi:hypothetical protein